MLPCPHISSDLREAVARFALQPLPELLLQHGMLRSAARDAILFRLREEVSFSAEEEPIVLTRLWEGVPAEPPASLGGDWLSTLPELLRGPLGDRWNQIRQQKWIEDTYRDRLEPYFLERRADLEQVVYGMIRLKQQGAAEELYLRLLDDNADFGKLAQQYSLGEERFTHGLVGPMLISQPHATIRAVLQGLTVGEIHPPFRVDPWVLLVRMEHRIPASLTDATRLQLYNELFEADLNATLDAVLTEIYPQLINAPPALPAGESNELANPVILDPEG
jgi:parvulin-like peptidyl-prolyl isomerase